MAVDGKPRQPATDWTYWRDKKGLQEALTDYYPDRLKADPRLQVALAQIEIAEIAINKIMADEAEVEEHGACP